MSGATKPRRFQFRFSLRTLFVLLTLFGMLLGWLDWNRRQVNEREKLFHSVAARGAMFGSLNSSVPRKPLTLVWSLLGATAVGLIEVPDGTCSEQELHRLMSLFPEARVVVRPGIFDPLDPI
jgi:hypothetical protein